ncbi:MAG: hypothetical protein LBE62_14465, partial [Azonexus sp.]|nr:hypothetical protein [Azonexus sp.]
NWLPTYYFRSFGLDLADIGWRFGLSYGCAAALGSFGGGLLYAWFGAGRTSTEYKAAARFVAWLLSPEIQVEITQRYGGLPLTSAARAAAQSNLLRDDAQTLNTALLSIKGQPAKATVRVANIWPVSLVANEELEAVWTGQKSAKAALDTAVSRGNALMAAQPALKKAQPF